MLTAELKLKKIQSINEAHADQLRRLDSNIRALELLEAEEVVLAEHSWDLCSYHNVKRDQIALVRKALGKLKMCGKDTTYDFDKTNEINVSMRPVAKEFAHMQFTYRTPFRRGGKCKVVNTSAVSTSLVCDIS